MADTLDFVFRAIDKASSPIKKIAVASTALERQLKRVGGLQGTVLAQQKTLGRSRVTAGRLGSAGRISGGLGGGAIARQIEREKAGMLRDAERAEAKLKRTRQRAEDYVFGLRMRHFRQNQRTQEAAAKVAARTEAALRRKAERESLGAGRAAQRRGRLSGAGGGGRRAGTAGGVSFGTTSALGSITSGLMSVVKWGTIAGGVLGGLFVKGIFEATDFENKMRMAFTNLTGDASKANAVFDETVSTARRLGQGVENSLSQVRSLLAKGFDPKGANELLRLVGDLQTVGVEGQAADRVLLALTQIKAKGKLQAEEMLQLNEAGIGSIAIYKQLGKILGKSTDELRKMQKAGDIGADDALKAVKAATLELTGKGALGVAAQEFAERTITGRVNKIFGSFEQKKFEIGRLINTPQVIRELERVESFINGINPRKFGALFETLVTFGVRAFDFLSRATDGFVDGFTTQFEKIGGSRLFDDILGDDALGGITEAFKSIGKTVADLGILTTTFFGAFFTQLGKNSQKSTELGGSLHNLASPANLEAMRALGSALADIASTLANAAEQAVKLGAALAGGAFGAGVGSAFGPVGTVVGGAAGAGLGYAGASAVIGADKRREARAKIDPRLNESVDRSRKVTIERLAINVAMPAGLGFAPNQGREIGKSIAASMKDELNHSLDGGGGM